MVRQAVADDAGVLAEIHIASWQGAYRGIFPDDFLDSLDLESRASWFEDAIRKGTSIVVEPDDEPRGFCMFGESYEEGWGEVFAIYVHPEHWGSGHGIRLLRTAEDELSLLGLDRVLLWVLDANDRARRFYEAAGWSLGSRVKLEEIGGIQVTEVRYELIRPAGL